MTTVQEILRSGIAIQAAGLSGENMKLLKKKKITSKRLVKTGIKNIVGIEMLKLQSQVVGGM